MAQDSPKSYLSVWSVASLGIGSMVGAGIFALMGQTVTVAGEGVYYAFTIGGIIALLSGYSYVKLGSRYPGSGGIMDYFDNAFPNKTISGTLSIIYLITLAITIALVSKAFGAYASRLFFPEEKEVYLTIAAFSSLIIVLSGFLNMINANAVGKMETALVIFKLLVLGLLIAAGMKNAHSISDQTLPSADWSRTIGSVGLTFFAYAGYGMMANTAGNLKDPQKELPRAIFTAIGTVLVLYILLSYVVLRNVPESDLATHADTAIAQAARPLLGMWGFVIVSVAALVASASAINATFFSYLRISRGLAQKRQLNQSFNKPFWRQGTRGFFYSIIGILLITNIFDLTAIANIASATFLICYMAVFVANWILRKETRTNPIPIIVGFFSMLFIFAAFMRHIYETQTNALYIILFFLVLSFILETIMIRRLNKISTSTPPEQK